MNPRPPYEALDTDGRPHVREARIISELPHECRHAALAEALPVIGKKLGLTPATKLAFGLPVFIAFGLNNKEASHGRDVRLLNTQACDLSLDFVPSYQPELERSGTPAGQSVSSLIRDISHANVSR